MGSTIVQRIEQFANDNDSAHSMFLTKREAMFLSAFIKAQQEGMSDLLTSQKNLIESQQEIFESQSQEKWEYAMKLLTFLANKIGPGMVAWCQWCLEESKDHHEACALNRFLSTGEQVDFGALSFSEVVKESNE